MKYGNQTSPTHLSNLSPFVPSCYSFFSTTFSPGSGVAGLKELRYLFARFYFWCMIDGVSDDMENCPSTDSENMTYLILSSLIGLVLFLVIMGIARLRGGKKAKKDASKRNALKDEEFVDLQVELYGERVLDLQNTQHSTGSSKNGRSAHGAV